MGVEGDNDVLAVFQVVAHILYLVGVDMGHGQLHCYGEVDYHLVIGSGLPYVQHGVAYLQSELGLGACEALGRVLKAEIALVLFAVLLAELCTADSDVDYLLFALAEYLLSLSYGGGVVKVDDGVLAALQRLKGLFDDVLS